jgi:uncharacterized protein (DUF885 family)
MQETNMNRRSVLQAGTAALALTVLPAHAFAADAGADLRRLFADSEAARLMRNPLDAIDRGDLSHADQFGDMISDAYYAAERQAAEDNLRRLAAIDRAKLGPVDAIAAEVFEYDQRANLKQLAPDMLALTAVRPLDHFTGIHLWYPGFASGKGQAPFKTVADYENNLKRHRGYIAWIDSAIGRFREGMESGVVQPKMTVANMIEQLDGLIAQGVEGSTYYGPVTSFPEAIGAADRARLTAAYAAFLREEMIPAHARLRDFLKADYLPAARESFGLGGMKGGAPLYALLVERYTTLPMTADEVHALGLSEVARVTAEMEAIRKQVGHKGTLAEFFEFIRTDPRFKPKSREALRDRYYEIGRQVDARVREQFSTIPKTPLEIRFYEEYREKTSAGGSYEQGTPDGKRPGRFYFNAYDLPSRTTPGMETLYLHEAVPGHHFQIALAQENAALPDFMRFGGTTAFVEGWALYAETLWREMGVQSDPYDRFGGLDDEMLRAMRLVVDTGLHAKGWSRDQAIKYMLDNSSMGRTDATAEVERYIVMPGQALAYKIGQLTISRLKAKAQAAMGARFDPRAFHDQVLNTGALPMAVLERKIDGWIKAA